MFGIKPIGIKAFSLTPRLPEDWNKMALNNIMAYGVEHNISITRNKGHVEIEVTAPNIGYKMIKRIINGESIKIDFN
jgi:hypothetical protein